MKIWFEWQTCMVSRVSWPEVTYTSENYRRLYFGKFENVKTEGVAITILNSTENGKLKIDISHVCTLKYHEQTVDSTLLSLFTWISLSTS